MTGVWRRSLGVLVAAALASTLGGCAYERMRQERLEREAEINVYPAGYRTDLVAAMRAYVGDPAGIRDAFVAEPAIVQIGQRRRYGACVRFRDGRSAPRNALAIFSEGRFDQFIDASALTDQASQESVSTVVKGLCDAADYKRFPELETMKR
jgi:hypothetical protein